MMVAPKNVTGGGECGNAEGFYTPAVTSGDRGPRAATATAFRRRRPGGDHERLGPGLSEKLASVHQTRTFAAANAAAVPLANSSKLAACASAHGQLLAQATVVLREEAADLAGLLDRSIVARRYFPRLSAGMHDKPIVDELVRCVSDDILITNIWIGEGGLVFPQAYGEELEILGPVRVGRGLRFSFSYSVSDIEILADLTV
jgi:acetoacetate decarboxylase